MIWANGLADVVDNTPDGHGCPFVDVGLASIVLTLPMNAAYARYSICRWANPVNVTDKSMKLVLLFPDWSNVRISWQTPCNMVTSNPTPLQSLSVKSKLGSW